VFLVWLWLVGVGNELFFFFFYRSFFSIQQVLFQRVLFYQDLFQTHNDHVRCLFFVIAHTNTYITTFIFVGLCTKSSLDILKSINILISYQYPISIFIFVVLCTKTILQFWTFLHNIT